ncbi:D-amino acid aminotransferase [Candidatus Poribacteria bacterium]|nr:D-amino acid aminotransferase [Candidatus Poribacteria bacterium]
MTARLVWLNGRLVPFADARVSIEDRGFQFADGIYEVVRFYSGRPFGLDEHLARWERSAEGILLEAPGTRAERAARVCEVAEANHLFDCYVYGQLTRGAAPRAHLFPCHEHVPATELWYAMPARGHAAGLYEDGVGLLAHPDERWARCDCKTISLLPNVLAKERARRAGCFEALFYREDGTVTECSSSNACCICDGALWTHPLTNRILAGVTRTAILECARAFGLEVREEAVPLSDFRAASEAFISSTTMEIMPVTRINGAPVGSGRVGQRTRELMSALHEHVQSTLAPAQAVP